MGGPLNSISEASAVGGESWKMESSVIKELLLSSCEYVLTP